MSNLDDLNKHVTAAIFRVEAAQRRLSRIEEEIAKITLPDSVEGRIARRGAVRAAVAGRDFERARELVSRFVREDGIDDVLIDELNKLLQT
mgnify:FL=1